MKEPSNQAQEVCAVTPLWTLPKDLALRLVRDLDNVKSEWIFVLYHLSKTALSSLEVFSLEARFDSAGER